MDKINVTNKIEKKNGKLIVPDTPTVPFITGDGVGAEITPVCQQVVDAAVERLMAANGRLCGRRSLPAERRMSRQANGFRKPPSMPSKNIWWA